MSIVIGMFTDERSANQGLGALTDIGVEPADVSVVLPASLCGDAYAANVVAVGAIAFPFFSVIAAGPIVAALARAGSEPSGGFLVALVDMGIPAEEAVILEDGIGQGRMLVAVRVSDGREAILRDVLYEAGAQIELAA